MRQRHTRCNRPCCLGLLYVFFFDFFGVLVQISSADSIFSTCTPEVFFNVCLVYGAGRWLFCFGLSLFLCMCKLLG